jgi:hypothetical protein
VQQFGNWLKAVCSSPQQEMGSDPDLCFRIFGSVSIFPELWSRLVFYHWLFSPNHPHAGGVENRVGDGGSRQDRIDFAGTIGAIGSRVHDTPDFAAA